MPYQNISATLSSADVQAIRDAIAIIRSKLLFLVNLTDAERQKLFKMKDKSIPFVQDALSGAQDHPEILPTTFNVAEFSKDVLLAVALHEVLALLQSLTSSVDDTLMAVGSEAMAEARQVYEYVKVAAKTTPGLKPLLDRLAARFAHGPQQVPPPSTPTQPTGP